MEIGPVSKDQSARSLDEAGNKKSREQNSHPKEKLLSSDSVEISKDARARLAEAADSQLRAEKLENVDSKKLSDGHDIDRLEKIRERIKEGFYNQPGVKSIIAKKIFKDINPEDPTEKKI